MAQATAVTEAMDREQLGAVWAPAPTVDPAQLDDAGLTSYRHPAEWRALVLIPITLIVVGLVLALLGPSLREGLHWAPRPLVGAILSATDPPGFVVMVVIVFVVTALLDILAQYRETTTILWNGAEITPTTFPKLYPIVEELRRRFRMPRTRVFVHRTARPGAYAFGVREPYGIVFNATTLRTLEPDEIKFILGREMGRIKLGHTRVSVLLGGGRLQLPGPLEWLHQVRRIATASYERAQELSADRIGLLATRDVGPAFTAAIKLTIGRPKDARLDVAGLTQQAADLSRARMSLTRQLVQLFDRQPALLYRLLELTRWAGLPAVEAGKDARATTIAATEKPAEPAPPSAAPSQPAPGDAGVAVPAEGAGPEGGVG